MNNPTSYELDKELSEISDWHDTGRFMWLDKRKFSDGTPVNKLNEWVESTSGYNNLIRRDQQEWYSLYTLEYLLDKLPYITLENHGYGSEKYWSIECIDGQGISDLDAYRADTPRNAVCKLAIELIKQEIIPGRNV